MKNSISRFFALAFSAALLAGCTDLDQNPLSKGSSENFYSSVEELRMAANDGYRMIFWPTDGINIFNESDWIADEVRRESLFDFLAGTLNGQSEHPTKLWTNQYKLIGRCNNVINNYHRAIENGDPEAEVMAVVAECYFHRACAYGKLASKIGDVPLVLDAIDIDTGSSMGRTPLAEVKKQVYSDFDNAIAYLPVSYPDIQRATKGAALAMKARFAMYFGDFDIAAKAAKACMDLDVYELDSDYGHLFATHTKESPEFVFVIQRSFTLGQGDPQFLDYIRYSHSELPRMSGGWATPCPTWDLLAMYTCTDGLAIDKSPLFDPHKPFDNRDPRCSATIIPFGEIFMGVEWDPSKKRVFVERYNRNMPNSDCLLNEQYASYMGLCMKKGMDEGRLDNGNMSDHIQIVMRYADVLLMYAEAKIELGEIDQSVVDAMNKVRARAYKCNPSETSKYPAFTIESQNVMRHKLHVERHMELATEFPMYMDFMRWRLLDKKLAGKVYRLYTDKAKFKKYLDDGNWFWPITPHIDEDGIADFSEFEARGLCDVLSEPIWPSDGHMYRWPIPTADIIINPNLKQNPGY